MIAYHGKQEVKDFYLARVRAHANADELIKGQYWKNGKGCAVGCTIHGNKHSNYEIELGIPEVIALLEDRIFEGLPLNLAKTWPERFLKSISPGSDLSLIWAKFASRLLTDPIGGVIQYAKSGEQLEVIQRVSNLYKGQIAGIEIPREEFKAAYYAAAKAAAYTAAKAAAAAANEAYAYYAAKDAANAAANEAYAAAYTDAAAYAARDRAYIWQSELLLELLKETK